jgi:hypothetical protein
LQYACESSPEGHLLIADVLRVNAGAAAFTYICMVFIHMYIVHILCIVHLRDTCSLVMPSAVNAGGALYLVLHGFIVRYMDNVCILTPQ